MMGMRKKYFTFCPNSGYSNAKSESSGKTMDLWMTICSVLLDSLIVNQYVVNAGKLYMYGDTRDSGNHCA